MGEYSVLSKECEIVNYFWSKRKDVLVASHFADRLAEVVKKKSTPLIVGLDPVYSRLPQNLRYGRGPGDCRCGRRLAAAGPAGAGDAVADLRCGGDSEGD